MDYHPNFRRPIQSFLIIFSTLNFIASRVPMSNSKTTRTEIPIDQFKDVNQTEIHACPSLPNELRTEIAGYSKVFNDIARVVLDGPFKGKAYDFLAEFVDKYGARFTATETLEKSIKHMLHTMQAAGLENVHGEQVSVPVWKRGDESLEMLKPRYQKMALLGLGLSVGTPQAGIIANIVVVRNFDELRNKSDQIPGKIVVFNQPWINYFNGIWYRLFGSNQASRLGAVAVLIRSVTPKSIYSTHTGLMSYEEGTKPIPAACITVEDAEMLQRIFDRGESVKLHLKMEAENYPDGVSQNTVAELTGKTAAEEVVMISGHIDSWDVGQGAMDDGGGVMISYFAPLVLKSLSLRPRRTIRTVLWTAEELGFVGAIAYRDSHREEWDNINIVLESDLGTFEPKALEFSGSDEAACILKEIVQLVAPRLNATGVFIPDKGSDSPQFSTVGIPSASLKTQGVDNYFDFHHSAGDTLTVQNTDQMDRCLVFWAFTSYVLADISVRMPRTPKPPDSKT